ncbi:MAG: hypothetical protein ACLT2B_16900, partial [Phocaeicola vulgatus]
ASAGFSGAEIAGCAERVVLVKSFLSGCVHVHAVSIRPRACFSPSYNKVKSQTKHVWLLTLL